MGAVGENLAHRGKDLNIQAIAFSQSAGLTAMTDGAEALLELHQTKLEQDDRLS